MKKTAWSKERRGWFKPPFVLSTVVLFFLVPHMAAAQESSRHFQMTPVPQADGTTVNKIVINGPPVPPPGTDLVRRPVALPTPNKAAGTNTLTVPAFTWVFGCSAVSGGMITGYYDRTGYPNMYTGPTNGGIMPLDNGSWPTWSDGFDTYPNCPLVASKNGVDGRTTRGSIDDYWIQYGSISDDPYITNGWAQHAWGSAAGDHMKTSQSAYGNSDGSTTFWWYTDGSPLSCAAMDGYAINNDGTQGLKLFWEARGYTVTQCFNQMTDNKAAGGFSYAQFKAEIDAGRPVIINLAGHTVVGVGYDDSANLVYLHDTWDYLNHTMTWGTNYAGLEMNAVGIINLAAQNQVSVTVGTAPAGRSFSVDGTTYSSAHTFNWSPGSSHTLATTSPQLQGTTRYTFASWSDGGALSHGITAPSSDTTYSASFNTEHQLTTAVSPAGKGTVSPATGGWYPEGSTVDVAVTPSRNYIFSTWTGPVADANANPTTVTMTAPATVTAVLTGKPTLTSSITAKSGPLGARTWSIALRVSGRGPASNVRLTELKLVQKSGTACTPRVTTALPVDYGNIAVGSGISRDITLDFTGCSSTAKFVTTLSYEANGGVIGRKTYHNQSP